MENQQVAVVLVTFNRLSCLKKALPLYENQTVKPHSIIVVNNCSTDGTKEYLDIWKQEKQDAIRKIVLNLDKNCGGAGGFCAGLKTASTFPVDWIWVADDDAYPEKDAIQILLEKYAKIPKTTNISALCTSVINHGEYDIAHRRRTQKTVKGVRSRNVSKNEYQSPYFEIDQGSYVGMMIRPEALKKVGFTRADFFIYFDDTEHSLRLSQYGKILCIPEARVHHDVDRATTIDWRHYYSTRNGIIMLHKHFGLGYALLEAARIYKKEILSSKKNSKELKTMFKTAIHDGLKENMGLHSTYKPGWKPSDM